jgi:glutathione S-transferase
MAFKLHGAPPSTCTRVVAVIAKERNIPFETVSNLDYKAGEHKQPAHLAHHPFGQVPYIAVRRLLLPQLSLCSVSGLMRHFLRRAARRRV